MRLRRWPCVLAPRNTISASPQAIKTKTSQAPTKAPRPRR